MSTQTNCRCPLRAAAPAVGRITDAMGRGGGSQIVVRRPITPAPTDSRVLLIDQAQYERNQGRCLQAMRSHRTTVMTDQQIQARWPQVAQSLSRIGMTSVWAEPIIGDKGWLAVLNLYSTDRRDIRVPDPPLDALTRYINDAVKTYFAHQHGAAGSINLRLATHHRPDMARAISILTMRQSGHRSHAVLEYSQG